MVVLPLATTGVTGTGKEGGEDENVKLIKTGRCARWESRGKQYLVRGANRANPRA